MKDVESPQGNADNDEAWCDVVRKKKKPSGRPAEQKENGKDPNAEGGGGQSPGGASPKGKGRGYAASPGDKEKKPPPPWRSGGALTAPMPPALPNTSSPAAAAAGFEARRTGPAPGSNQHQHSDKKPGPPYRAKGHDKDLPADDEGSTGNPKGDITAELNFALSQNKNLHKKDFDNKSHQFLHAIHSIGGRPKVKEVIQLLDYSTKSKTRESIKNWPGYIAKILHKFYYELKNGGAETDPKAGDTRDEEEFHAEPMPDPRARARAREREQEAANWSENSEEPPRDGKEKGRTHSSSSTAADSVAAAEEPPPPVVPSAWMPSFRPGGKVNATKLSLI